MPIKSMALLAELNIVLMQNNIYTQLFLTINDKKRKIMR